LGVAGEEKKQYTNGVQQPAKPDNPLMPTLSENSPEPFVKAQPEPVAEQEEESMVLRFDFIEPTAPTLQQKEKEEEPLPYQMQYTEKPVQQSQPQSAANINNGSYLHRPSNIYAEAAKPQQPKQQPEAPKQQSYVQQPQPVKPTAYTQPQPEVQRPTPAQQQPKQQEPAEDETSMMELVIKESQSTPPTPPVVAHPHYGMSNEEDEKRTRAQERLAKLRNLSYNMSSPEVSNEFDNVPAYVRRNMELFGSSLASAESYYSKVTVNKDDNNETQLSTLNTFLDGKKPD